MDQSKTHLPHWINAQRYTTHLCSEYWGSFNQMVVNFRFCLVGRGQCAFPQDARDRHPFTWTRLSFVFCGLDALASRCQPDDQCITINIPAYY